MSDKFTIEEQGQIVEAMRKNRFRLEEKACGCQDCTKWKCAHIIQALLNTGFEIVKSKTPINK